MNKGKLQTYAPEARRDFIKAVTERANYFGIAADKIEPAEVQGDVAIIGGRPFQRKVILQRDKLIERVQRDGFELTMRKVAYTWFNRFMALRYMELHNYLDYGFRVLSHPNGSPTPEILEQATHVELAGLDRDKVVELKLDGTKDAELYRMLLVAECNTLHLSMPFLFETIDGPSELLLPDNLLHSDSVVRKLVTEIDEEDWQEIEIIGWLYQFYISDKKEEVIGKVVKSEDIPAATQLFTPNWIVKYMVQNSLGAQWLATYPNSPLKEQMEYYIEPAEQTDEVKSQLAEITPGSLDPEELTLIDPACGSGHILVEAYDLFKAIYLERGYRQRDVAKLILEKNLYGLDIDERAAQMAGFALMMKGRADDRRLFERDVKLNVMALVDSADFDAEALAPLLLHSREGGKPEPVVNMDDLTELKRLFEHATTFGSLIQVPEGLASSLPALKRLSEATSQDLFVSEALKRLGPLVQQVELLAAQYDAVVANPPYMGNRGLNPLLREFRKSYPNSKYDLFAMFIERGCELCLKRGRYSYVVPQSWMFLTTFSHFRSDQLSQRTLLTLNHFDGELMGIGFKMSAFAFLNYKTENYKSSFQRNIESRFSTHSIDVEKLKPISGEPLAYWVDEPTLKAFVSGIPFSQVAKPKAGMLTTNNDKFVRYHWEICVAKLKRDALCRHDAITSRAKWFPYNKGGGHRKWYGNDLFVLNFADDGSEICDYIDSQPNVRVKSNGRVTNRDYYYRESLTWSDIGFNDFAARRQPSGSIFDITGMSAFPKQEHSFYLLGFLCSPLMHKFMTIINPTFHFQVGDMARIPVIFTNQEIKDGITQTISQLISQAQIDWDSNEVSHDFQSLSLLTAPSEPTPTLASSYTAWIESNRDTIAEMKRLEEENNRLFIDAYGLQDELIPDVPVEQITLTVNPAYRYGGDLTEEEQWNRLRTDTMQELISYAIGCMMGRYSLDEPGLIYAHSGNEGFDPSRYQKFPADDDGIVPITDIDWFDDDASNRFREFLVAVWGTDTLNQNLEFLAESLGQKASETPEEAVRRYLSTKFFKDHLQTYKKRPIYWLFSSGKQKAFECLVYLHRYNESTLSRMRNEYVIPLQGKYSARVEYLANEIQKASSASAQKKLQKELDSLKKKQAELAKFDDELRHYADQRISIDLDDGVKVNYGKFGSLLAEVKAVTGKK